VSRRILAVAFAVLILGLILQPQLPASATIAQTATWGTACDAVTNGQNNVLNDKIDPILSYGTASVHMHSFFGARGLSTTTVPSNLINQTNGITRCGHS